MISCAMRPVTWYKYQNMGHDPKSPRSLVVPKGDNGSRNYLGPSVAYRAAYAGAGVLRNVGIGAEVPTDCNTASKKFVALTT